MINEEDYMLEKLEEYEDYIKLARCPFCGSNDLAAVEGKLELKYVVCHACGAEGPKYRPWGRLGPERNENEVRAKYAWNHPVEQTD
jgi:hypothetical protein